MKTSVYSLRKSQHIFFYSTKLFKRKKALLSSAHQEEIRHTLHALQTALVEKEEETASFHAHAMERKTKQLMQKNLFDHLKDIFGALLFALVVAVIVRQVWFEFYEIPTGSMRPTFKEQDRLVVSKTQFGVNIPLTTRHLYFDPNQVPRGGIVVFTGENMDIYDVDTMYFYIFPGKKQFIKRLIARPGDQVYFYGGKIYGIDKDGQDITKELSFHSDSIDHIPYMSFEGKAITSQTPNNGIYSPVLLFQMNEPVAKLSVLPGHRVQGEMLKGLSSQPGFIKNYEDLWGFKNYAMARLLSKQEMHQLYPDYPLQTETPLYLELQHSPSFKNATLQRDLYGRLRPIIGTSQSIIPLNETHMKSLFSNLYTARFIVEENGLMCRYGYQKKKPNAHFCPKLEGVPPGTYEFYHGKAYQIHWQGITKELPLDHPLYTFSKERLELLFNLGIECDTRFAPDSRHQGLLPSRYSFFRDGDLYVMGAPIIKMQDSVLVDYIQEEHNKQIKAPVHLSYSPFVDFGAPLNEDGSLNVDIIKQYGLTVPDKTYLVLGDNYAMSADSRDFGFVPEGNLRGTPKFIFWPPGDRFGIPLQPGSPIFTLSRVLVWTLAALILVLWNMWYRRRHKLPIQIP